MKIGFGEDGFGYHTVRYRIMDETLGGRYVVVRQVEHRNLDNSSVWSDRGGIELLSKDRIYQIKEVE